MRLTRVLFGYHRQRGNHPGRFRKNRWREQSAVVVPEEITFQDPRLQIEVEQSGKEVVNTFWNPPWEIPQEQPPWIPERDDPRFKKYLPQPPIESHPLWKDKPAYTFHDSTKLPRRFDQAKVLTKSLIVEGLPFAVEDLIGAYQLPNQDQIVRRHVLGAVAWDQTRDELPKYYPPAETNDPYPYVTREDHIRWAGTPLGPSYQKQAENLLGDLMRFCAISNHRRAEACQGAQPLTESLKRRHYLNDCDLQTVYSHVGDDLIRVGVKLHGVVYADAPLAPPAGSGAVRETVDQKLPELWPMKPTVDMLPKNIYDDRDILTFKKEKLPTLSHPLHPHTIGIPWGEWWDFEDHTTRALMITFAATLAQARLMYGDSVQGELPSPVVLQSIATNGFNFNFLTFQLNTVDFSSPDGVKNIAWIDAGPGNNIREDWRPSTYTPYRCSQKPYVLDQFNPGVFEKVLATYLNGAVSMATATTMEEEEES